MPQEGQFGSGSSGGGSGTVTSVSGTTNQIDVTGGTGAATVSLDATATNGLISYALDSSGAANTITLTIPNLPTALTTGTAIRFKAANTCTGATSMLITPTGQAQYA
jgi:hypothetical protein